MAVIYALCDPETMEIRYIGKADDLKKRMATHIRDSRRKNQPVHCWIKSLARKGKKPQMVLLEEADDWEAAEVRLIAKYRDGGRLLNVADGGNQPYCHVDTLQKNGNMLNSKLKSDPLFAAYRELMRRGGLAIIGLRELGKFERAASVSVAMERIKVMYKQNPSLLQERLQRRTERKVSIV